MKILVCGQVNGSIHDEWEFEIADGCDRVIITPARFTLNQAHARVWGFKGDRQVEGELVGHTKDVMWMA